MLPQETTLSIPNVLNLYKVRDTYYFRTRIPKDLLHHFDGQQDFKRTLHTKSLKQAKRLLKVWTGKTEEVFTTMRTGALSQEQLRQLADNWKHDTLRRREADRIAGIGIPQGPGEVRHLLTQYEDDVKFLKSALSHYLHGVVAEEVSQYLQAKDISVDPEGAEFKQLAREVIRKKIEVIKIESERIQGNYENGYDDRLQVLPVVLSAVEPVVPEASPPALLISEAIDKYITDYRRSNKANDLSIQEYETTCRMFQSFMDNKEMKDVGRDDFRAFHDALKRLPSHMNKKKEYRDKSIQEILAMEIPTKDHLSSTSIEARLGRIRSLLSWAEQEGILAKNPGAGLTHQQRHQPKGYLPFDSQDIHKMVQGFALVADKGELKDKPERVWLPLLGLFTGARVNELAQLHIEDVCQEKKSGIWYLRIEGTEEDTDTNGKQAKRVKNASSNRAVPIHPLLQELGFLEYYQRMKEAKAPRLWMNLTQSGATGKYHKNFANWFLKSPMGEGFKSLYMSKESKKTFHSFRKSFTNCLKQRLVLESVIQDIVGHKHGTITFDIYTQPHHLETMLKAMEQLDYEADFEPLKKILKVPSS